MTGTPASAIARAVPPLDSSVQPSSCEAAGELDDAGLVVHGQQGGGHPAEGNERAASTDKIASRPPGGEYGAGGPARERIGRAMEASDVEADGFGVSDWLKAIGGVLFFVAGLLTWWELEYADGLSVDVQRVRLSRSPASCRT